ncbi:beta-lactamase family protein [Nocardia tengchongensis]|uniref:Beta-lactamase family protein n=1 Tax=Nocardia tengchongensis TaxID=2055889 RepID=A0ABX8CK32_9NOCA|nr:serine hydrolase domain-containing protein [Nocardia tengchongensis]QVI20316.1 beta-lactamase family protein [Nocardia tengchongensis]
MPEPTTSAPTAGACDERFARLRELLTGYLDSGEELGAAIAVTVDGEPVVDIWGGWADTERTTPWQRDTITNVWSCTKTVTALAALVLVERGLLDVDAPVSRYWPEFAAAGKERVLVRHLLSHTSGVAAWNPPMTVPDMYDTPVVACGGEVDGVRLLSPRTIDLIFDTQSSGPDLVLGAPLRFGIGYGLPSPAAVHIPDRRVCFWGGWGGSLIAVDTERRATISYVMNKMGTGLLGNERTYAYASAAFAALG